MQITVRSRRAHDSAGRFRDDSSRDASKSGMGMGAVSLGMLLRGTLDGSTAYAADVVRQATPAPAPN